MKDYSRNELFREYVWELFDHAGIRAYFAILVLVAGGLTQGVGLLMLIPFLQLIGIGDSAPTGIVAAIGTVWNFTGLPLNLPAVLLVYIGIVTLYAAAQRWSTILNSKLSHAFTRKLRDDLFSAMARVQWLRFMQIRGSEINHVMTANLTTIDNGTYGLFALISTIFVVIVHIGIAMMLSVPLTCVAIISSGILLIVLRPLNRRSYALGEEWRQTMAALFGVLMDHLSGMKIAKSFGAEERHIRSFCRLSGALEQQANRFSAILSSTSMYYEIGGVVAVALFFFVGVQILHVPAAKLLVMVFLFGSLVPLFSWMQRTWQGTLNMLPAYKAVVEMRNRFHDAEEALAPAKIDPLELKTGVEFRRVSFSYIKEDPRYVLNEIDLVLAARETTVILGPSGGGKSTFADLLIGLLTPDSGQILIDGKPLSGDVIHSWRKSVGYVPQESLLFHETLQDNMRWAAPECSEDDIWHALRLAAAHEFVKNLPEGLNTVVGDRGVRLSGGQRQRIALARALLRKPTLLLLDEATSNLDVENEQRIMQALQDLRGTMTVVFISHRQSAVECADRVIVIEGGRAQ
ncbi:ABC transporter ATP-binding protein [Desulfomonile tiedjei]|uniref:ABC-type multidrug transport system, ATPase and permease component n=1 Tax=Desulfomonile tiedjei (strain ATCC 49306 / DSM 6799 / DCB-1) TaxID=706587 RepID=I4C1Q0_DESTA|nr:ABC transporter ATP-binding protein [Desulfomonile tiedjei]AFM23491.1 ABC-type multidrug transport system, ATPase and permease component [Desulfomonile tiedjei DSM 6799]